MDIYFSDPSEVPLPPEEMRIRNIAAEPLPDGRRVRINLELDPFQRKPNIDLVILDKQRKEIVSTSIIESVTRNIEIVLHLSTAEPPGDYQIHATLFYFRDDKGFESQEISMERSVVDSVHAEFSTG